MKARDYIILKFGGTSVSSLKRWKTISSVVKDRCKDGYSPIVVCSAISGISDALERLFEKASQGEYADTLREIVDRHKVFAKELGINFDLVKEDIKNLEKLSQGISLAHEASPKVKAQILGSGELMLTKLGGDFLRRNGVDARWIDARNYLVSDSNLNCGQQRDYLSAKCKFGQDEKLKKALASKKGGVFITQGFIAGNEKGETVLLGRGGSDVSASYFASKLSAKRCEIWTDVPGMYTANPHLVPEARVLRELHYKEAQEIASLGAKVLHPFCVPPLVEQKIPLHVCCVDSPDAVGTVVSSKGEAEGACIKAVSSRTGITIISMETAYMWHQAGFLSDVFNCFKRYGISVDLVSTSETNVTVTLDKRVNTAEASAIKDLIRDLGRFCNVKIIESCAMVSLVGSGIRAILHQMAPALEIFEDQRVYLVSQAANDLNLTFVVDEDQAIRLVRQLHAELFGPDRKDSSLGPSWQEIFGEKPKDLKKDCWWYRRRKDLLKLALKKAPLYVYDEATMKEKIAELQSMKNVDRILYSIKANANNGILKRCFKSGLSFECVSPEEVLHILKTFPKIDPQKILFTPNFVSREEYELAFKKGIVVTLDNLYPLQAWPELFENTKLFIRIDPGEGRGHHKYVKTAGAKSKFGISIDQLGDLQKFLRKSGADVIGLHAHVGSNIYKHDTWSNTAKFLVKVAEKFPNVGVLDLGGGLGVVERLGKAKLDLNAFDKSLSEIKDAYPKYKLWIEPGRFIVANAGVLLASVTQIKEKGGYSYIGCNVGMNTFIRPALYGSYHEIFNLTRIDEEPSVVADIVGPICESGDVLGHSRHMPAAKDGDIILIDTVGAYGWVMSSCYNMRQPADEHFLF